MSETIEMKTELKKNGAHTRFTSIDLTALIFLIAGILFYCYRANKGMGVFEDESFYLTIPYRLSMGDSLFCDEWHVSQLSALLQYPLVKLFLIINGSASGLILYWRHMYIVLQSVTAAAAYIMLRSKNRAAALLFCLVFYFSMPFSIMSVSYNQTGICFSLLTAVMFYTYADSKKKNIHVFITGILFALSVLGNPFIALLYLIYVLAVIIHSIRRSKRGLAALNWKVFLRFTAGIAAAALPCVIFILSRASLSEIAENFPNFFKDPEYAFTSGSTQSANILINRTGDHFLPDGFYTNPALTVFAVICLITTVVCLLDKKRLKRRNIYIIITAAAAAGMSVSLLANTSMIDYTICELPLTILAPVCYFTSTVKDKRALLCIWLYGIVIGIMYFISSDTAFYAMNNALCISGAAGAMIAAGAITDPGVCDTGAEKIKGPKEVMGKIKKPVSAVLSLSICLILLFKIYYVSYPPAFVRLVSYDSPKEQFTQKLNYGPYSGIYTTPEMADNYMLILKDMDYISEISEGPLLTAGLFPYCYLCTDLKYGSFDTWFLPQEIDTTKDTRYVEYYRLHPERIPDIIYIPKQNCAANAPGTGKLVSVDQIKKLFSGSVIRESSAGTVFKVDSFIG